MARSVQEEKIEVRAFAPTTPAIVWGALMVVALVGAGATVLRSTQAGPEERFIAADDGRAVQRDLNQLASARNELAGRLATLERSFGALQYARGPEDAPGTTGSISRKPPEAARPAETATAIDAHPIGVVIGRDGTMDEIRRRWSAVSERYPQQFGKLVPRTQRSNPATGLVTLVAGPFQNSAEADRACTALAEQGLACDTTGYAGAPIGRP